MRVGVRLPGAGDLAFPDAIAAVAQRAEALGFDHVWMTDHLVLPTVIDTRYPYTADGRFRWPVGTTYLHVLMTLCWAAAATKRIAVGTSALIAPLHPIVETAKALSSLDHLSAGRLVVSIGAGWMREQFEIVGASFSDREETATLAVAALKDIWTGGDVDLEGKLGMAAIRGFRMRPSPVRGDIPVWCGGSSDAALARVAEVGDGWHPIALPPERYARRLRRLKAVLAEHGRSVDDVTLTVRPLNTTPADAGTVAHFAHLGVSDLVCDPSYGADLAGALEDLEKLADAVLPAAHAYREPRDLFATAPVGRNGSG